MKKLLLVAVAILGATAHGQTTFKQGDIAILGYNASNPDIMSMVSFTGFTSGTSLILTDYGWLSDTNTFRFGGEGYIQATATRDFAPGEVFAISSNGAATSDYVTREGFTYAFDPTVTGVPQYAPSAAGDGTIVFQGTIDDTAGTYTGTLLYGVNAENTGSPLNGWQANSTNSNTSALPSTLVDGQTALGLARYDGPVEWQTEFDNYEYVGTRTGSQSELLASIGNRANWTGTDTLLTLNTSPFTVTTAVPEPATLLALGLGAAAVLRRRRKA